MADKNIAGHGMTINAVTNKGGAAVFNAKHGVWASYAVATAGDLPPPEVFYAGAKLPDGRTVQFFLNRETGLVVVDVLGEDGRGGTEILRQTV